MYGSLQMFKMDTIRKKKEAEEELSVSSNISKNVFLSQTSFAEYSHTQTVFEKGKEITA